MHITMPADVEAAAAELVAGTVTMTPAVAALLREPFKREHMGKLPKITCGACRGSRSRPNPEKVCGRHEKIKCRDCRNWITEAHMHLDYVGHAEVTDRLITVDPMWTWAPLAFDSDGLPKFDQFGALWIKLTVAGKTMIGYGDSGTKTGPDAVKEVIGDAIRNAAMRLGVALDLWGATFKAAEDDAEAEVRASAPGVPDEDWDNATPAIGRGQAPAEQPHVPARPVNQGPPAAEYDPALYDKGVQAIAAATSLAQLDELAAHIDTYASTGQVSAAEAGRLRMKLGDRRDALRAAPVDDQVPGAGDVPAAIAANALTTTGGN